MLLHWELAQTFLSTSPQTCLSTFPQNKDTMFLGSLSILRTSLKKETWAICYEKKRVGKYDEREREKMSEKKCRANKRGWPSKIAHDLNLLGLERKSLRSKPSTHIHTLALLIMFVCCFPPWIHALTLQYKHSKYAFQVLLPQNST